MGAPANAEEHNSRLTGLQPLHGQTEASPSLAQSSPFAFFSEHAAIPQLL